MFHPELRQLTRAELLFDAGKLDEALELLNDQSHFEGLNFEQKHHYNFLKGQILSYQTKVEELIYLGGQIYKEGQKRNEYLKSFDGLYFILIGLIYAFKFDEAFKRIEKAEILLKLISNRPKSILIQREVRMNLLKAWINLEVSNIDIAEKCLEQSLGLEKELGNTFEIVWVYSFMSRIMFRGKSRYDLAIEYSKKALSMAKKIKFNHFWIALNNLYFGRIYQAIGELSISLKYSMKSLAIFKEIKSNWFIAEINKIIGEVYIEIGDYDIALKHLEESLLIFENLPSEIVISLSNLVEVALEKGDIKLAQKYYNRLENLYNQKKDGNIVLFYQLSKALILKRSSRIRDKAKAEELLKQVIEIKTIWSHATINALVHLCDMLLSEFRINNNSEVLDEINQYINKLLAIAEKSHSYKVFCETFLLQAKLALLNLDVKAAQRFLIQAQKIAESYGIKRLAMKISNEHDELLRQLNMWENLKETEASLSERWKLAGLNDQIENMVKKRITKVPELTDEKPVLLLIVSEGGRPLLTQSFVEDKSFESHLFGGFLTTIDYFIREMFSEGLDRAIFGEYTLLMKSTPPFFISYVFKGDSYYAYQKINYFVKYIQKEDDLWQNLLKSFQVNQTIHLKDIPLLESLITEIFITKNIIFREL
ncbi:MAG: tetratricopeptide repeat protein [Promethearchaeota archaeon]